MRLATSPGDELKKTNKVKPVGNLDMTGDELLGYYYDRLYGDAVGQEDTPLEEFEEEGNSVETASDEIPDMKVKTPPSREEFETLLVSVAASYQAELDRELQQEKARKTKSSLEVKVENGAKKTTPPLVKKKKPLDVGLKDDVSEMETDEDDGDRQKLREIIREDPGIGVIAAKSVQKRARKARLASRRAEKGNDPTKHTKPKKGSEYYRTADGKVKMGSTAANNPPYLDRMMEDGVPIKQWALVIGLLGLAILQLKKSILLPASTSSPFPKKKSQSTKKTKGKKSEGSSSSKSQSRGNSSARTKSKMESAATSPTSTKAKKRSKKVTSNIKVKKNSKTSAPSTNGHSDSSVVEPTLIEEVSKKHVEETAMNNKAIEMALNDTNFDEGEWLTVKGGVASTTVKGGVASKPKVVAEQVSASKPRAVAEQVSTSKPRAVAEQVSTSKPQAVAEQVSTSKPRAIKSDTDNSHKAATAKVVSSEDQTLSGNTTSTGTTANENKPMALEKKNHTMDQSEDAEIKLSETKKVKTVETPVATITSSPISIEVDDAALARKLQMQEDLALQSEDAKSSVDSWEQVTTKKKKKTP